MGDPTAKTINGRSAAPPDSTAGNGTDGATGLRRKGHRHTLLRRVRTPRGPRLWFEILLIGVSYWLYSQIRNEVPEQHAIAERHAHSVWSFERSLGLGVEHTVNHAMNSVTWLIVGMNYYYATLHFIITIGVLVWLYVAHPGRYGPARLVLFATTWLALLGFWLYPLAPPRLMAGAGFIDTVQVHDTWGSLSNGNLSEVSNQSAAMPSLHIGWASVIAISVILVSQSRWRWLVLAHFFG
ncbi:MAG: hypothetical protein QOF98_1503, partial [Streptomyces sp.]|nr:hypothetical protein [Streptomyces sp.]